MLIKPDKPPSQTIVLAIDPLVLLSEIMKLFEQVIKKRPEAFCLPKYVSARLIDEALGLKDACKPLC